MNTIYESTWQTEYGEAHVDVTYTIIPRTRGLKSSLNYRVTITATLNNKESVETVDVMLPIHDDIKEWYEGNSHVNLKYINMLRKLEDEAYFNEVTQRTFNMDIIKSPDEILEYLQSCNDFVARDRQGYDSTYEQAIIDFWDWLTTGN